MKETETTAVVQQDASALVYNRHAKALHAVSRHIVVKQPAVGQAVLAQCLHHLVVVHLQSCVQDVNLVILLALVLIHAEVNSKQQENTADAEQQIALKGFTSQSSSHSLRVF